MPYVDKDSAEIVATPVQRKMSGGSDLRSARTGSTAAGHKSRVPEAPAASITVNNNCASLPADGSGRHKHGLLSAMAGAWQEDSAAGLWARSRVVISKPRSAWTASENRQTAPYVAALNNNMADK